MSKTAVLLIGFGGPEKLEEVRPFLDSVLEGVRIPPARYEEVFHHYELIGGASPYKAVTARQKNALQAELQSRKLLLPVYAGFRHAKPHFKEVFEALKEEGVTRVVGFILAPHRSYASFEKYKAYVEKGREAADANGIEIIYTDTFYENPLFIEAQALKIKEKIKRIPAEELPKTFFLFTAHSIPVEMSEKSGYAKQFEKTSALLAAHLHLKNWATCYQSRSGNPKDPWLEPDVRGFIENMDKHKFKNVLVVPCGFLCDNVEVLYDLDTEAKEKAEKSGLNYLRAETVMDSPLFIKLTADLVEKCLK